MKKKLGKLRLRSHLLCVVGSLEYKIGIYFVDLLYCTANDQLTWIIMLQAGC